MKRIILLVLLATALLFFAQAETMVVPELVCEVAEEAFSGIAADTLVLHENASLAARAFADSPSLRTLVFRGEGCLFAPDAFENCPIEAIYCKAGSAAYEYAVSRGIDVYAEEDFYTDWDYAFSLKPDGSVKITEYKGLSADVAVPERIRGICVTEIGANAFRGNRAVSKIILPETIEAIGSGAFTDCAFLKSINLPGSLEEMGENPFVNCSRLTITLDAQNAVFRFYDGALVDMKNMRAVFYLCSGDTQTVTLPEGLKSVGRNAFRRAGAVTKVVLPESVRDIGDYAFYECYQLKNAALPDGLTDIGDYAFYGCESLTNVRFPEGLARVGNCAFRNCYSLGAVTLPEGTVAGENVFLMDAQSSGTIMNILPLYQFDYRKTICIFYGEEKSVATSGCGAACVSMAARYLLGNRTQTPETLFTWAYEKGYYTGDGLSHNAVSRIAGKVGLKTTWTSSTSAVLSALRNGMPVIAHMGAGTFAESGHYILLRGIDENGMIVLNDPNSRERTETVYSIEQIKQELKTTTGFCIVFE